MFGRVHRIIRRHEQTNNYYRFDTKDVQSWKFAVFFKIEFLKNWGWWRQTVCGFVFRAIKSTRITQWILRNRKKVSFCWTVLSNRGERRSIDLAKDKISESALYSLWLQRLPTSMQAILSTSEDDLNRVTQMTDKITEINAPAVSNVTSPHHEVSSLRAEVSELTKQIQALNSRMSRPRSRGGQGYRRSRTRNRSQVQWRSQSRGARQSRTSPDPTWNNWCWYHQTFRPKAKKCEQPYQWKEKQPEKLKPRVSQATDSREIWQRRFLVHDASTQVPFLVDVTATFQQGFCNVSATNCAVWAQRPEQQDRHNPSRD